MTKQFRKPKFAKGDVVQIRGTNVVATIETLSPLYGRHWYIMRGMGGYYDETELSKKPQTR